MDTFGYQDFINHFETLGIENGMHVVCHSSLFSFGRCSAKDALDALLSVIGDAGTIVAPAYHFDIATQFEAKSPISKRVGAFSSYLYNLEGSTRSLCPVHSHVATGSKATGLLTNNPNISFGKGSDFDWLSREGFELILLGCSFRHGATFLHHVEALCDVPYRKWVSSPKSIVRNGESETMDFKYFARSSDKFSENFDIVIPEVQKDPQIVQAPYGKSYRIALQKLQTRVTQILADNPYFLVQEE